MPKNTRKLKVRGLSELAIVIILIIVAIAGVAIAWYAFQGRFLQPLGTVDIQPDFTNSQLIGKVGKVVFTVSSGRGTVTVERVTITDANTGAQANCQLDGQYNSISSGTAVSATCQPPGGQYFVAGRPYVVTVTLKDDSTGATVQKSFRLIASG